MSQIHKKLQRKIPLTSFWGDWGGEKEGVDGFFYNRVQVPGNINQKVDLLSMKQRKKS